MRPDRLAHVKQDHLAMSVAGAVAVANEAALADGTDPTLSLVTIAEETSASGRSWRINYGPRDYIGRRGGDLIVIVDAQTQTVQRVIHGQ